MPYITKKRAGVVTVPETPGELNYMLTDMCVNYLKYNYGINPSYAQRSEIVTALECAKLEFYRRNMAKYEDEKRGDMDNIDPYNYM